MSKVVMHNAVWVDGFIADDQDDIGHLFDWYVAGDFGDLSAQQLLADPDMVRGDRVLHLRHGVRHG